MQKTFFKWLVVISIFVIVTNCSNKNLAVQTASPIEVFCTKSTESIPYRIPAIASTNNGNIIAVADFRHSRADIGVVDSGRIDLRIRISNNEGWSWDKEYELVQGKGINSPNFMQIGFGDPCIVADQSSNHVLVISCAGNVSFWDGTREIHQNIVRFYSYDNGISWSEPVDITESIYTQFDNSIYGPMRSMFVGSGKIAQSRTIKLDRFYRLYCAILGVDKNGKKCNFVLFSDTFGETWKVLGEINFCPIWDDADEPKVEELPNGSVLLSSRIHGGRRFNIFTYDDTTKAEGTWATPAYSNKDNNGIIAYNNSTNGEILCLPVIRKCNNQPMWLLLQSVPFGPGRTNVGIYYKVLASDTDYDSPSSIAKNWDGRFQVSTLPSAYSTMTLQSNGTIGFLYEEDTYSVNSAGGYTIWYKNFTIEQLTNNAYSLNKAVICK